MLAEKAFFLSISLSKNIKVAKGTNGCIQDIPLKNKDQPYNTQQDGYCPAVMRSSKSTYHKGKRLGK